MLHIELIFFIYLEKMNALTLGERKNDGSMLVPQEYRVVTEGLVNVFITSNCNSFTSEKKFSKDLTVADLKNKLELITGASALSMTLTVFDKKDSKVCELSDGNALLGSFPVDSGMRIHVEDLKYRGEFEDPTVKKFELTPDDYSKRDNTVQSYLKRNKMGKYNEEEMKALAEAKEKEERAEEEAAAKMKEGDRCLVTVPGNMSRRGTVRFVGKVHFKPGESSPSQLHLCPPRQSFEYVYVNEWSLVPRLLGGRAVRRASGEERRLQGRPTLFHLSRKIWWLRACP